MKKKLILLCLSFGCKSQVIDSDLIELSEDYTENLKYIKKVLEEDIPNYKYKFRWTLETGFIIDKQGIIGVNIYNLNTGNNNKVNFKNNHVYHISPNNFEDSFSYIVCVVDNRIKIFKAVNCPEKGDTIEDALLYIKKTLPNLINLNEVLERVNNYRKYGTYIKTDAMTYLKCHK